MTGSTVAEPLRVTAHPASDGVLRLAVVGDVDMATAPQLRTAVLAVIDSAGRTDLVELDLAETTFLDAVGVRVLLDGHRAAAASQVRFAVRNPRGVVAQILAMTGLTDTLDVLEPVAEEAASVACAAPH